MLPCSMRLVPATILPLQAGGNFLTLAKSGTAPLSAAPELIPGKKTSFWRRWREKT